eukprot:12931859-Prorocentrum_lima.AAC.1
MLRKRLSVLDPYLSATQYGFRSNRGTADALFSLRRALEVGEGTRSPVYLLFLDWEKAFDKLFHPSIENALIRYGVPEELTLAI